MVLPLYDRGVPVRGNRHGAGQGQAFWCCYPPMGSSSSGPLLRLLLTRSEIRVVVSSP